MAEPRDSMLDPKYIGGIIGNKGYAFQNAYILHRLPDWLADPTFVGLQPEGWDDVEVFFEDEAGKRREAIQVKDHPVTPSEAKEIFREFQHRAEKGERDGISFSFRLASLGVSKQLQPVKTGVKVYQARTGYTEAEKAGTRDDLARRIEKLRLEVSVEFLLERVIFEADLWDVSKESVLRNDLKVRLHEADYGLSLLDAEYAYIQLAIGLDHWLREKRYIPRQDIEEVIRGEAGRHPKPSPPSTSVLALKLAPVLYETINAQEAINLFHQLMQPDSQLRVLRLMGKAKMGKSHLLTKVLPVLSQRHYQACCAVLDLHRNKMRTISDCLYAACAQLQDVDFNSYYAAHKEWISPSKEKAEDNGSAKHSTDANWRMTLDLTTQFVADLRNANNIPLLLLFDAIDNASESVQSWLMETLLIQLAPLAHLRMVMAGRSLPEAYVSYASICCDYELRPVEDDEEYIVYCHKIGVKLVEQSIRDFAFAVSYIPGLFAELVLPFVGQEVPSG